MPTILAVVPARAGSKGLPGKNLRPLGGVPLIGHSISAAREAGLQMRIVCSTDDQRTAEVAQTLGAEVPGLRPPSLATDLASTIDVVKDLLQRLDQSFDELLLLQPTSPLRTPQDILSSYTLLSGSNAVVGVREAEDHPFLINKLSQDGELEPYCDTTGRSLRRQDLPGAYVINGAIYWIKVSALLGQGTFTPTKTKGYIMQADRSIDIDTLSDFEEAERLLSIHQ